MSIVERSEERHWLVLQEVIRLLQEAFAEGDSAEALQEDFLQYLEDERPRLSSQERTLVREVFFTVLEKAGSGSLLN
jgi:hypothetical protein